MRPLYFTPRHRYRVISLTGTWCALNCSFCNRRYLENMIHVNPSSFESIVRELYEAGVRGILLSGGFKPEATLPIEPYIEQLCRVKRELGLFISAHLGLIRDRDLLENLRGLVDVVDFEFTLSSFIVNNVRRLPFNPRVYIDALARMIDTGFYVVPHVFAWYPGFSTETFTSELKIITDYGVKSVTLLVYIEPVRTTEPHRIVEAVLRSIETARSIFPGELYMGCMRPGYVKPLLDKILVEKSLVDRIANPHYSILREYPGEMYDACCSIILNEYTRNMFRIS